MTRATSNPCGHIRVRIRKFLERRGVVESRHELTLLDDNFADREPALAQLAAAAVTGLLPAGSDLRQHQPIALRGQPGVEVTGPRRHSRLAAKLLDSARIRVITGAGVVIDELWERVNWTH